MRSSPLILYVATEDWYFLLHRLPMALAAQRAGYEVHVATNVNAKGDAIAAFGFHVHPVQFHRGSINPFHVLSDILAVRRVYRRIAPDIAHHVALQAVVLGSIAALGSRLSRLNTIVGLGFVFAAQSLRARLLASTLKASLRFLLNRPNSRVSVENDDDRSMLEDIGIGAERIVVIPGSGVDTDAFALVPEPDGPMTIAFVGRLVVHKGIRTLIAAHDLLAQRGVNIRLLIVGQPDPANPNSIPDEEIAGWHRRKGVTVMGHVSEIHTVWAAAHIAVLPSYGGEGLPVSMLEAAACGRPMIVTDTPGCREIGQAGVTAILVPPADAAALADAIELMAADRSMRHRFGVAARKLAETEFSAARVGEITVEIYDQMRRHGGTA